MALSYSYTFADQKYRDVVCILACLAQAAIDNAKRTYACDIPSEIRRLKKEIDLKHNGYPVFWRLIRPDFNRPEMINKEIQCPMNYLNSFRDDTIRDTRETLPMDRFFIRYELKDDRRRSKKVERLIQEYSLRLYQYNADMDCEDEDYLLLRQDFDKLIEDVRRVYISNNYLGLMSWLIDRALRISDAVYYHSGQMKSNLYKNRALLFKTLYEVSPRQFLQCFSKNASKSVQSTQFAS